MVGAIVAAAIVDGLTPGPLAVSCALGSGANRTQGMFIEMFATAALTLSVLMLAAEKSRLTPMAPVGISVQSDVRLTCLAGFRDDIDDCDAVQHAIHWRSGKVSSSLHNGVSLISSTARAFGPAVITGFTSYHWIYCA